MNIFFNNGIKISEHLQHKADFERAKKEVHAIKEAYNFNNLIINPDRKFDRMA